MKLQRYLRRTPVAFINTQLTKSQFRAIQCAPICNIRRTQALLNDSTPFGKGIFQIASRGLQQSTLSGAEQAAIKPAPEVTYKGREILASEAKSGEVELIFWNKDNPSKVTSKVFGLEAAEKALSERGVILEEWECNQPLLPDSSDADVIAAYQSDVKRIKEKFGFVSTDVLQMTPDFDKIPAARKIFLSEHTHAEEEARFMIDGSAAFYLNLEDRNEVVRVVCTKGTLLVLPIKMKHWYDMSEEPSFRLIRFFGKPDGWIAKYTGSDIAYDYPLYHR